MRWMLLLAVVAGLSSCSSTPEAPADPVLATVGGDVITVRELEQSILDRYYGRLSLLGLVRASLFRQAADALGVEITEAEVQGAIAAEIQRMVGSNDPDTQAAAFKRRGLELADLTRNLRSEAENWLLMSKVAKARRSTEDHLQRFYEQTYKHDRVLVRHIAFPFGGDGTVAETQVEELRKRAQDVRGLIDDGADFSQLAARLSGNPDTGPRGGEIGWLNRSSLNDEQMTARIFSLSIGEVSEPIREGDYGWHLFKVEELKKKRPLAEVREELLEELRTAEPGPEELSALEEILRRENPVVIYDEAL